MASAGQAEKRLDRILEWKGSVAMQLTKPVVVAVALLAIPVVCVTAAFRPTIREYPVAAGAISPASGTGRPGAACAAPEPAAAPEPPALGRSSQLQLRLLWRIPLLRCMSPWFR